MEITEGETSCPEQGITGYKIINVILKIEILIFNFFFLTLMNLT